MKKNKSKKEEALEPVDFNIGLTREEIDKRKAQGLVNKTAQGSTKTVPRIVFSNIFTFFNLLNIGLASWLISVGAYKDIFFMVIVTANTVIGIIQEIKAKNTIDKLSLLSAPVGTVIRDGEEQDIAIDEIVLNDMIKLSIGRQITADCIVRDGTIEVDESLLTGESDAIVKNVGDTLYSGSFVVSGACLAEAVKVGNDAYVENITKQAKKYRKPKSDLMRSLKYIIGFVGIFIIPAGIALFFTQVDPKTLNTITRIEYSLAVRQTAGAMIGMIPSGLFLLTSIALAVGVLRLAQNNTLVQELYCIEMLARIDTLCLDKTGTITDGSMSVRSILELDKDVKVSPKRIIPQMMAIFDSQNQTSQALIDKLGVATKPTPPVEVINFSSKRKYSAIQFEKLGTFAIGAPEFVLSKDDYANIKYEVDRYAEQGLRVLVYAYSKKPIEKQEIPSDMKAHSLILIEDTIRPDAILTIEYFKTHGVDVKVISGDNPVAVAHIAQRAGIENAEKYISLEGMSDREVALSATQYQVFGRVSPQQKKILIQTLKSAGRTVAMTGDGVNDILALREADTSIAMASGSEAARNVSHLVLLDSNFSSMPKVVNEGRRVINNVQKVATLFLTKTLFSIFLVIISLSLKIAYPITPSQLFIIDFFVIGIPAFILSIQPNLDIVKGKFLANVMKKALPGALVVALQTLIVIYLRPILDINAQQASTLIVISATFTAMVVLHKVLTPFNTLRRLLFFIMFTVFVLAIMFLPDFFEFNSLIGDYYSSTTGEMIPKLPLAHGLLLIILVQSANTLITFFSKLPGWIKRGVKAAIMKLSGI